MRVRREEWRGRGRARVVPMFMMAMNMAIREEVPVLIQYNLLILNSEAFRTWIFETYENSAIILHVLNKSWSSLIHFWIPILFTHTGYTCLLCTVCTLSMFIVYSVHCKYLLCTVYPVHLSTFITVDNLSPLFPFLFQQTNKLLYYLGTWIDSTLYTLHCTLYPVHFTLYTLHCTLYTVVHFTLYTVPNNSGVSEI